MAKSELVFGEIGKKELKFDTATNGGTHNVPADCKEGYLIVSCYGNVFTSYPTLTITGCDSKLLTRCGSYGVAPIYWVYKITNLSSAISVKYSEEKNSPYGYTYMQIMY